MCILHENAKNKLPVIDRFFWHRSRKPGGTGGDWNFPLLQKTPFFLLVTAEISQVAPGLAKFTYLTKMAFFGKFVMVPKNGNKMVLCNACNTGCVSFEVDILKH